MGLSDIVRSGIATANSLTANLQDEVLHEPWIGNDKFGKPMYGIGVSRPALVERKAANRFGNNGQVIVQNAQVTFIYPISPNGAARRQEPVDPRDRITLPDGWTGPIVNVQGLVDPSTGLPYMTEVSLGPSGSG